MKHKISGEVGFSYTLTLTAELEHAPIVPVNSWTQKEMQPRRVTVTYFGPGRRDGGLLDHTNVVVTGKKRRPSDGVFTTDEMLYHPAQYDWLQPVLDNLAAVALDEFASRLRGAQA